MLQLVSPEKFFKSFSDRFLFDDSFFSGFDQEQPEYPPYNIWSDDQGNVNLELSVCGFNPEDIAVEVDKDNTLIISGVRKDNSKEVSKKYFRQKLAQRNFKQQFKLFPTHEVGEVEIKNGILTLRLNKVQNSKDTRKIQIKY